MNAFNIYDQRHDQTITAQALFDEVDFDLEDDEVFVDHDETELRTDDCDERVYRRKLESCIIYYHDGSSRDVTIMSKGSTWKDYFSDWATDQYNDDFNTLLAAFGLEPDLESVEEDYKGTVKIWVERYFFESTCGSPKDGWLTDDDHEVMLFDCYDDAQAWIDEDDSETYLLAHGEYERPAYTICAA